MSTDLHSLMAPYALNALDDEERARFEAHLEQCADCQAEMAGFMATAVRLGGAAEHTPPPGLRERLLTEIGSTPQERPIVTSLADRRGLRRRLPRILVAAAVLVGVVGAGGYVVERQNAQEEHEQRVAVSRVLSAPDAQTVAKSFPGGGNVRMVMSSKVNSAVIYANNLPRAGKDKVYQVWLIGSDGPHSQGTFVTSGDMVMDGIDKVDQVAVTVEPKGGSKKPTTAPVALIPV
ncbi:anti-sigma factor [Aeromicrobium wangtongii]|uniref:Regulator of SigK n=1 Tax=Aeromicrobium wangtongii TaxID=2969247 RepID=A0ABY5M2S5_9ACTN|nr:anti-sigma factor [Aeromicrobium wangtongii]MCD9198103.1 anti-sigma factor [Aeromicrobium wangtongii]UUP12142.1 anti-sigma factor [Aeromicrobium wangtongii]